MSHNQTKNIKTKLGFSLIELGVVLIVIGILIVGASGSYSLVKSSQISNARGLTSKSPIGETSGLLAWYETSLKDSLNQSQIRQGAQTTEWKDISANSLLSGNNKLTVTASNNITYLSNGINKIPSLKFTGASRLNLTSFSQGLSSQATIFLVFQPDYTPDTTNYKTLLDGNSLTYSISIKGNAVQLNAGVAGTTTAVTNSFLRGRLYIMCAYFNSTRSQVFLNNTSTLLGGALFNSGTNQLSGLNIGATRTGTLGFIGNISEVAIFNRVLKANERKEIFNYFSKKYKIEVTGI